MAIYPLKLYIKYRPNLILLVTSLVLNAVSWFWLLWNIRPQTEEIFLHYTVLYGVDLVGPWSKVLYLPISGLFIILVNAFIGWILFREDRFFAQIFNGVAVFCQCILLIATTILVFLNV